MFRKISSAAAHSSSLAPPFTCPPKPTPLNSADAHSYSSITYLYNYARPPYPTPLISRNSTSDPNNWLKGPKFRLSTARLRKFLKTNYKSGDVSPDEAFRFFHRMVQMEPRFPLYSFNLLLWWLAENWRYYDVLWLYGKMNSVGLIPNFVTLNILLKCLCYANRVRDGFLVLGRIMRMGYSPNVESFNYLIEGFLIGIRVHDACQLYWRLEEKFDFFPDMTTCFIFTRELNIYACMICGERGQPNVVGNSCKEGKEDKARELSSDIDVPGHQPVSVNPMAEHVKGQEELKLNIHSKEKAPPTFLARPIRKAVGAVSPSRQI